MADFASVHRPHLETLLEDGEELRGVCAASQQQGMFRGRSVAIAVTDRRLLIQPLDRRGKPSGEALSITSEQVVSARAGDTVATLNAAIVSSGAAALTLRTTSGDKVKLMMMRGTGVFGGLSGGEPQRRGAEALGEWLGRLDPGV
jgi:hypothetical protein